MIILSNKLSLDTFMVLIFLLGFTSFGDILTKILFPTIFSHYMFILYDFSQVYIFHNLHEKELD